MNPTSDNFEGLRRLLALKRYEQPPPGYFHRLTDTIMARIEAETARESWWQRWLGRRQLTPALAGAFALFVGGFYFLGLTLGEHGDPAAVADNGIASAGPVEWSHPTVPPAPAAMVPAQLAPPMDAGTISNARLVDANFTSVVPLTPAALFATPSRFSPTNDPIGATDLRIR